MPARGRGAQVSLHRLRARHAGDRRRRDADDLAKAPLHHSRSHSGADVAHRAARALTNDATTSTARSTSRRLFARPTEARTAPTAVPAHAAKRSGAKWS